MLRAIPILVIALCVPAHPVASQQGGTVNLGVFMTVPVQDTEDFEASLREHSEWHAAQNDPWTWAVYQSLGGVQEYVTITPNHDWADFDNPPIPMSVDQAEFANSEAAALATSEVISIWEGLPDLGNAPPAPLPLALVIEFEVHGDEAVLLHAAKKYKEATAGAEGLYFGWARVVSADGPPTYFVVVWANSFAELGTPGPTPLEIMTAAHGLTEARQIMDAVGAVTKTVSNRIWIARPDLSHIPS